METFLSSKVFFYLHNFKISITMSKCGAIKESAWTCLVLFPTLKVNMNTAISYVCCGHACACTRLCMHAYAHVCLTIHIHNSKAVIAIITKFGSPVGTVNGSKEFDFKVKQSNIKVTELLNAC